MALLDINNLGKNPIIENRNSTPLDIQGFEAGENLINSVKDLLLACGFKLVQWQNPSIEWQFHYKDEWCFQWSATFLSIEEFLKKYPTFKEKFKEFMKNGITQEAKIFPHLDSSSPKDKANPPMKKRR